MNKFSEVMRKHSDEMLINMINNHSADYVPEAIEAIKEELKSRGIEDCIIVENRIIQDPHIQEKESVYDVAIREIMQMEYNSSNN